MTTKNITVNHDGGDAFYNICNEMHAHTHEADNVQPKDHIDGAFRSTSTQIEIKKLRHYIQRSELSIADALRYVAPSALGIAVMHGEGGTGKTTLCRAYARDRVTEDPNLMTWWVNASSVAELQVNMESALADVLKKHEHDATWTEAVRRTLSSIPGPWLLILNDVCASALAQLHDIIPPTCAGRVVLNTNERPDAIDDSLTFTAIECRSMSSQQAVALLRTVSGCNQEDDSIYEDIAKCLSYLPFALDIAGTYIKNQNKGRRTYHPRQYLEYLRNDRHQLLTSTVQHGDPLRNSVYKVIAASVLQVQAEFDIACGSHSWPVEDTLRLLSFFSPDDLPLTIMPFADNTVTQGSSWKKTHGFERSQTDWVRECVEALAGVYPCSTWSVIAWEILITTLHNFHLLHINEGASLRTYSMQSILHGWAQDTLQNQLETFNRWKITATAMLASARPYQTKTPSESTVLLSRLFSHWQYCQRLAFRNELIHEVNLDEARDLNVSARHSLAARTFQELLFEKYEIFKARGRAGEVLESCRALLDTRVLHCADEAVERSRTQLAECLESLGDHNEALRQRLIVLQAREHFAPSAAHVRAVLDVAKSLTKLGRCEEAYTRLKSALSDSATLSWAEDDCRLILVQKRFAITCQRTGRSKEARHHREALLKALKLHGYDDEHAEVLDAKLNLANSYFASPDQRKKDALELQEQVAESESRHLPEDHPRVLLAKSNLAWTLVHMNTTSSLQKASDILTRVLQIRYDLLGPSHVISMEARIRLAVCELRMTDSSRWEGAQSALVQCIREAHQQSRRHEEIRIWAMKEFANARIGYEGPSQRRHRVLNLRIAIYEAASKHFGFDSTRMLTPMMHLADALEALGFWHTSLPFRARTLHLTGSLSEDQEYQKLRAKCRLAVSLGHTSMREWQTYANTLFAEVLVDAKVRCHEFGTGDRTLGFCVIPYLEYLRSQRQYTPALNLIASFLNDPEKHSMFLPEDITHLEAVQRRCQDRMSNYYEPPQFHQVCAGTHMSGTEHDDPLFPLRAVSARCATLRLWERKSQLQFLQSIPPNTLPAVPCPLPWDDECASTEQAPLETDEDRSVNLTLGCPQEIAMIVSTRQLGRAKLRAVVRTLNGCMLRK